MPRLGAMSSRPRPGRRLAALASMLALLTVLAACAPNPAPEPVQPEVVETAAPAAPEISPEEITASFEIPIGLSDQELAETYIERINAWWNYAAAKGLSEDERLRELGLGPFALDIAEGNARPISEGLLADSNTEGEETNTAINANSLELFIQSELKGEAPYEHTLTLVSLDAAGSPGVGIRVLRLTVDESSNRPEDTFNSKPPFKIEVRFVVEGEAEKVESQQYM